MIFKVFYQETTTRNPRRETTHSLYLQVDAEEELTGRILAQELIEKHCPNYNVELIQQLNDQHLEYEKETGCFELTEFPS